MCKISEHPDLYSKAEGILRSKGIKSVLPGYQILKRAIIIYKVDGKIPKEKLLKEVSQGKVIPFNKDFSKDRSERAEQWMIEALKTEAIDIDLMDFIEKISDEL